MVNDDLHYRYDISIPDKKLIIEMNGRQHYTPVMFFCKTMKGFEDQVKTDKIKQEMAIGNGYKFITFSYKDDLTMANVRKRIEE